MKEEQWDLLAAIVQQEEKRRRDFLEIYGSPDENIFRIASSSYKEICELEYSLDAFRREATAV